MSSKGKATTDHDEIRRWAEVRSGRPMAVRAIPGGDTRVIRLAFPDLPHADAEGLDPISWDEWFRQFEADDLALLIEETTSDGRRSTFNKLVSR
ncbi:MAG TPA: hypothetical protein VK002_01645 [Rubricoccaceae bacterium]|nr:hypothetical protein [Rubricoccaceae bacterium]